jgi:hypothetical protein
VSAARTIDLLLRAYPARWRERYGEELESLIVESSDGERVPWRVRLDVVRAGVRERMRAAGLSGDAAPPEQVRGGVLLVLCAWALFVVAGLGVQKFSEHWQAATPASGRGVPSAAFGALLAAAIVAGLLVLAGVGSAMPALARLLRHGGWPEIRRHVISAGLLTVVAVAATAALVIWAGDLSARQRDGHDAAYAIAFAGWALLAITCLAAWTAAGVVTARRLQLSSSLLRVEARIAVAAAVAMALMTAATVVWWGAMAHSAPWFLAGHAAGRTGSPLAAQMVTATALMVIASALAVAGAGRAIRALPAVSDQRRNGAARP